MREDATATNVVPTFWEDDKWTIADGGDGGVGCRIQNVNVYVANKLRTRENKLKIRKFTDTKKNKDKKNL